MGCSFEEERNESATYESLKKEQGAGSSEQRARSGKKGDGGLMILASQTPDLLPAPSRLLPRAAPRVCDKRGLRAPPRALITPQPKTPAKILVYKANSAPLLRERFWLIPSSSRDPSPIAKAIRRQAARISWRHDRRPESAGMFGFEREANCGRRCQAVAHV